MSARSVMPAGVIVAAMLMLLLSVPREDRKTDPPRTVAVVRPAAQIPAGTVVWRIRDDVQISGITEGTARLWGESMAIDDVRFSGVTEGIVVLSGRGKLRAIDVRTGREAWRIEDPDLNTHIPWVSVRDVVLTRSETWELEGRDPRTGRTLWTLSGEPLEHPRSSTPRLFVSHGRGHPVSCIDSRTGKEFWSAWEGCERIVTDGIRVIAQADHVLSAFKFESGRKMWTARMETTGGSLFAICGGILVIDEAGMSHDALRGIDVETGEPKWSWEKPPHTYQSAVLAGLIVAFNGQRAWAIDPVKGRELWSMECWGQPVSPSENMVCIVKDWKVHGVNPRTGKIAWTTKGGWSASAAADGLVFAATGLKVTAMDGRSGRVLWESWARSPVQEIYPAGDRLMVKSFRSEIWHPGSGYFRPACDFHFYCLRVTPADDE